MGGSGGGLTCGTEVGSNVVELEVALELVVLLADVVVDLGLDEPGASVMAVSLLSSDVLLPLIRTMTSTAATTRRTPRVAMSPISSGRDRSCFGGGVGHPVGFCEYCGAGVTSSHD